MNNIIDTSYNTFLAYRGYTAEGQNGHENRLVGTSNI